MPRELQPNDLAVLPIHDDHLAALDQHILERHAVARRHERLVSEIDVGVRRQSLRSTHATGP